MPTFGSPIRGVGGYIFPKIDPLEQQIQEAKLAALQQEPALERARLQLEQEDRARLRQALEQQSYLESARLGEESGFHQATLAEQARGRRETGALERGRLAEESRYHTGELGLGERRLTQEKTQAEEAGRRQMADVIAYHAMTAPQDVPGQLSRLGISGEVMKRFGYPQLAGSIEEVRQAQLQGDAKTAAAQGKGYVESLKTARPDLYEAASALLPDATATPTPSGEPFAKKFGRYIAGEDPGQLLMNRLRKVGRFWSTKGEPFWEDLLAGMKERRTTTGDQYATRQP